MSKYLFVSIEYRYFVSSCDASLVKYKHLDNIARRNGSNNRLFGKAILDTKWRFRRKIDDFIEKRDTSRPVSPHAALKVN